MYRALLRPGAASRMAAVLSLYRRHRPRTFDEVVGQEHIVRTLRNAIELGKVHHAYLFVGSRGTGKTSMAKLLACALNAEGGPRVGLLAGRPRVRRDPPGHVARRRRDGRRLEQLRGRHPRPARERRAGADGRRQPRLHPRRGAHALDAGLERVPEDARGAAVARGLRARDHRGAQGAGHDRRPLPPVRLPPAHARADRGRAAAGGRAGGDRGARRRDRPDRAPCDRAASATRSARSSSSSPTAGRRSSSRTCSRSWARPTPSSCSTPPRR